MSRKLINASRRNPFPYIHHCIMPLCRCAIHKSAIHQIHHYRRLGNVYRTEEPVKRSSLRQTCFVCCRNMSAHIDVLLIQPSVPGASSTRLRYQWKSNNWCSSHLAHVNPCQGLAAHFFSKKRQVSHH